MADIIKSWPAKTYSGDDFTRRRVLKIFTYKWSEFYFTIGRGRPKQVVEGESKLWYCHRGKLLGHFVIRKLRLNTGDNIPVLKSISGETSEWQIKVGRWVAICPGPFIPLRSKSAVYHDSFRGFRYFSLADYLGTMESQIP